MKKLISLLVCLILVISCASALAASLAPESVIGTWALTKATMNGTTYDSNALNQAGISLTLEFHADKTGKMTVKSPADNKSDNVSWDIQNGKVIFKGYTDDITLNGSSMVILSDGSTFYLVKTSDTTSKKVSTAYTSLGEYKLNNSKKTAALKSVANKKASSLKIPDTIPVNGENYKVVEISAKACASMAKLTKLTVGKNVKTIGASAFSGCKKLKKIVFSGTALKKVGSKAFSNVPSSATVTCPKNKVSKYKKLLQKGGLPTAVKFKGKK